MSDVNIFEQASRLKLRFKVAIGELKVEDLWDLPLTGGQRGLDLNAIAISVDERLTKLGTKSFVEEAKPAPEKRALTVSLEILKHIIAHKQEQQRKRAVRAEADARRRQLAEALANKQDDKIKSMSEDDILKELKKLDEDFDEAA